MPDVFTKAKRSEVMSRIRSRGNKDTELALIRVFRAQGITGWRRHVEVKVKKRNTSPRPSPQSGEGRSLSCSSGFCFPQAACGRVRGRLFLALLSAPRHEAAQQRGVLANETRLEPSARPAGDAEIAVGQVAGASSLGT